MSDPSLPMVPEDIASLRILVKELADSLSKQHQHVTFLHQQLIELLNEKRKENVSLHGTGHDQTTTLTAEMSTNNLVGHTMLSKAHHPQRATSQRERKTSKATSVIIIQDLKMDLGAHLVTMGGKPLQLSPLEYRILKVFMESPDKVFTRTQLKQRAWNKEGISVDERIVDVHIRSLRKILHQAGGHSFIQTVRGVGYRFSAILTES